MIDANLFALPKKFVSLYACGDIHGEFKTLIYHLKRLGIENAVIVVAGDCGLGFEKENHYVQLYDQIGRVLDRSNNLLILVRGNHDDPNYFDGHRSTFPV